MDQWLRSVGQGALEEQHHLSKTQSSRLEEHLSAVTLIVLDCRAVSNLYVGDLITIFILIIPLPDFLIINNTKSHREAKTNSTPFPKKGATKKFSITMNLERNL